MPLSNDSQRLVDFYKNEYPNGSGYFIDEILNKSDSALENSHDFIQWLFPLKERSVMQPESAPPINDECVEIFKKELQPKMLQVLKRMLDFYGLIERPAAFGVIEISRKPDFKPHWITGHNHNFLRITRILKSLRLMGLEYCAKSLKKCLDDIYKDYAPVISPKTYEFWNEAMK